MHAADDALGRAGLRVLHERCGGSRLAEVVVENVCVEGPGEQPAVIAERLRDEDENVCEVGLFRCARGNAAMIGCRGCGEADLSRVLDLGKVPAADHFPLATDPVRAEEASHALAMDVCGACGLAQLADDDTVTDEPRGVEPQALKDQAEAAIEQVGAAGWLRGDTVVEFGSPHGGTWIPLLAERGFTTVDVAVRTWCWTVSASCTNRTSGAPSRGAPRSPARAGCCCCNTTRSSRSSSRANGMRCGTGISRTTR